MPRPYNTIKTLTNLIEKLLYEKKKDLEDCNWMVHRTAEKFVAQCLLRTEEFGKIKYIFAADSANNMWLRITQTHKPLGVEDRELLNIPLNWLPPYWKDEFQEMIAACLFVPPLVISTAPAKEPPKALEDGFSMD